jgi:hypothetical protein
LGLVAITAIVIVIVVSIAAIIVATAISLFDRRSANGASVVLLQPQGDTLLVKPVVTR